MNAPDPQRFQRTRLKGHRLPEGTVCVTRGTKWGNPFIVRPGFNQADAVALFERELLSGRLPVTPAEVRRELAGKHLACWCKPGTPCHAEVLLRIANAERQPLAVELLLPEAQRVTVEEHKAFRDSLNPQPEETEL